MRAERRTARRNMLQGCRPASRINDIFSTRLHHPVDIMGAQQSSAAGAQDSEPVKRCYYEVLGVDRHATEDESGSGTLALLSGLTST